jgi:large subunit ribosomal protein L13
MAVVDASGLILGRLCTHLAKRLLNGEEIFVVNAEKALVSGRSVQLKEHYKHRTERASSQMKAKGPYYPRTADMMLKRAVRGMLQYKKPRGRDAYRRLKVYVGVPKEFQDMKAETLESAKKPHLVKYTSLGEIAKHMGSSREVAR